MTTAETIESPRSTEPARARALLSTADFRLIKNALAAYARATEDDAELAKINSLFHRLGTYR